jgi:hypothetical protein
LYRCLDVDALPCDGGKVCGCDAEVYDSDCDAYRAGVAIASNASACETDGLFRCGEKLCEIGHEYCEAMEPDGCENHGIYPKHPTEYTCRPLPTDCDPEEPCSDCLRCDLEPYRSGYDGLCRVAGTVLEVARDIEGAIVLSCLWGCARPDEL